MAPPPMAQPPMVEPNGVPCGGTVCPPFEQCCDPNFSQCAAVCDVVAPMPAPAFCGTLECPGGEYCCNESSSQCSVAGTCAPAGDGGPDAG